MARTKNTARKERTTTTTTTTQLPPATKGYRCQVCQKGFQRKAGLRRHLGLIHDQTIDGQPIDPTIKAKYISYNKRKVQPSAAAGGPTPSTVSSAAVSLPIDVASDTDKETTVATPDEPSTPVSCRSPRYDATKTTRAPSTTVTAKLTANVSSPAADPHVRKRTQPTRPGLRKIKTAYDTGRQAPLQKKVVLPKSKRRLDLNPSSLAKRLRKESSKSSTKLVAELSSEYNWTTEEQRAKVNVVRGMRAAQRDLCAHFRRHLPIATTPQRQQEFLSWLEDTVKEIEDRDSDEFV